MASRFDESTPLLTTVRVAPPRQRYSHHRVRILCNFLILGILCVGALGLLFPFLFDQIMGIMGATGHHLHDYLPWSHPYPHSKWPQSEGIGYEELQSILLETPSEEATRSWSKYYTAGPHLAGKNLSQALWTKDRWQEFGVADTSIVTYDVYLNYPLGHRLALYEKKGTKSGAAAENSKGEWAVKFEAKLEEDVLEEDPTSGLVDRIPTFHGYSASGNVTAPYVYVNYGTIKDFEDLLDAKVDLKGKIALIKYGRVFRGLKVRKAQELGMVGAIIYSDPGDDGDVTVENGEKPYPEGKARQPSSVQRGSAEYLSKLLQG
jgi:N-acetylated-alpha-linked acidic dipeptidase